MSYPTLKQWIYQGKLMASRTPGGHYRIAEQELTRLRPELAAVPLSSAAGSSAAEGLRVSGRNQLRGVVASIRRDGLLAAVRLRIGDQYVQAVVTAEAVEELGLEVGQPAIALIKATEVMLMR